MGTTDDETQLLHVGFTLTLSATPFSSPRYHLHVKGPNFHGIEDAIVFDVDDDDPYKAKERAVALAKEKYDATFTPD
jgi:hypothetical protein